MDLMLDLYPLVIVKCRQLCKDSRPWCDRLQEVADRFTSMIQNVVWRAALLSPDHAPAFALDGPIPFVEVEQTAEVVPNLTHCNVFRKSLHKHSVVFYADVLCVCASASVCVYACMRVCKYVVGYQKIHLGLLFLKPPTYDFNGSQ